MLFRSLKEIIPQLPVDKRGIIYTHQICQFFEIRTELAKRGIVADGFWSVNNMDHSMTEEELEIRKSVVLKGIIPDYIQVLLINAASESSYISPTITLMKSGLIGGCIPKIKRLYAAN